MNFAQRGLRSEKPAKKFNAVSYRPTPRSAANGYFPRYPPDTFHWQNITVLKDGGEHINGEVRARRR